MKRDDPIRKDQSDDDLPKFDKNKKQKRFEFNDQTKRIFDKCRELKEKSGVHSVIYMAASGLKYTGVHDRAICEDCKVELSNWTNDKKPFHTHSQERPECSFVISMKTPLPPTNNVSNLSISIQRQQPCSIQNRETGMLNEMRKRTFSHWPRQNLGFEEQLMKAGFFYCNIADRMICIYCNLICQQWVAYKDEPCKVHKTLSPDCSYVRQKLSSSSTESIGIVGDNSTRTISNNDSTAASNVGHTEVAEHSASVTTMPQNLSSINDLARAGFSNPDNKIIETCDYCNRSLEKQGPDDNPMVEHVRRFPNCGYLKSLNDTRLHRQRQQRNPMRQGLFEHDILFSSVL